MLSAIRGVAGLVIVAFFVLAAILAPLITSHDPVAQNLPGRRAPPSWQEGGTLTHPLGTDQLGRDVWSRLVYGARTPLIVALGALAIGGATGTVLGFLFVHYRELWYGIRGVLSTIHAIHSALSFPLNFIPFIGYFLAAHLAALISVAMFGPGLINLIIVMGLVTCPRFFMVILTAAMRLESTDSVPQAGESSASEFRSATTRPSPKAVNILAPLLVSQVGFLIIMESVLGFLGLTVLPPTPSWGATMADGRGILSTAWWISAFPAICIILLVGGFYMLGSWLRDRLDVDIERAPF